MSNFLLNATGDVVVETGGGINADGNGYGPSQGPGAGGYSVLDSLGGGGGYGGYGGAAVGTPPLSVGGGVANGLVIYPLSAGSGGGGLAIAFPGSAGGGVLRINTPGMIRVDGTISANGNHATTTGSGGGAGGGVWLTAGIIAGAGTITANGGNGNGKGGGGGGGRIAIQYATNYFSGDLVALGGHGINCGGAGTAYSKAFSNSVGEVVVDNGGRAGTNTSAAFLNIYPGVPVDLTVIGSAVVETEGVFSNLVVGPNSALIAQRLHSLDLSIRGNATIQEGGALIADGLGWGPGTGGGGMLGQTTNGVSAGGGGYGGYGASGASPGAFGGGTYGSVAGPDLAGRSGGGTQDAPGGAGGGLISVSVDGTLTVLGRISANGNSAVEGGGGAGGYIRLSAGSLVGSGTISANGGNGGPLSGGGGGGRIIMVLNDPETFGGSISTYGGGGYARGGAGTIFIHPPGSYLTNSQVWVDNGGHLGTNTPLGGISGVYTLVIRGGAMAAFSGSQAIQNLLIETNSWFLVANGTLSATDVKVQAGSGIEADGMGFAGGLGIGAGTYSDVARFGYVGSGGGYGGSGANAGTPVIVPGGATYGSFTAPTDPGSSAGYAASGSAGGGVIRIIVSGTLDLEGILSANGWPGALPGSGGGSGGSLWLTVGALNGNGLISANGGSGNGLGGGGGGGRIALEYTVNNFTGPITAFGGGGANVGGAGTIYLRPVAQPTGRLIIDNGGQFGAHTRFSPLTSPYDLAIKNGAFAELTNSSLLLSNVDIGWGGSLSVGVPSTKMSITVLRDAVVEPGGSINLDGRGYARMTGPGSGTTTNGVGSGGGYGGNGGASSLQPGGGTYGSALQPFDPGSSGGFGFETWTNGSEGGGALLLTVGHALRIDGTITANGNPGLQDNAGGGSGGSLWLSANALSGTGELLANGGGGELFQGGGGGGGRIAIYSPANFFSGLVLAAGGDGFTRGQDGTIYYASTFPSLSVVGQTPNTAVTYAVSSVDLSFSTAIAPGTATNSGVSLVTPNGPLTNGQVTVAALGPDAVRLSFPPQTAEGAYSFTFGTQVQGLYWQSMSQPYTGSFGITWPVIQGLVTDAQNRPMAGVLLQPNGGLPATQTDVTGLYSLKVVPSGNVTITPSLTNLIFLPGAQNYADVTASLAAQNYLAVTTIAPTATIRSDSNGPVMSWQTLPGVTYQAYSSTNLVDWTPYGPAFVGGAGSSDLALPTQAGPQVFFRVRASN